MQLFAYDTSKMVQAASRAERGKDYLCLECNGLVRVRGGVHRRPHFYHLAPSHACRQNGKSMTHLQVQCALQEAIGSSCKLEVPFPQIARIADVVWPEKQLIFEVQCSPISADEVLSRNKDYASAGFQVIWVLHRQRFGKKRVSAAEQALESHPHYFTTINAEGEGGIFDWFQEIRHGKRVFRSDPLEVQLNRPVSIPEALPSYAPFLLPRFRQKHWSICFEGDLVWRYCEGLVDPGDWHALESQRQSLSRSGNQRSPFTKLRKAYIALLHLLLERACR